VLSYIGTAIVDLAPNEVKNVSLRMMPGRTRLLVPDQTLSSGRVVQLVDFTTAIALRIYSIYPTS